MNPITVIATVIVAVALWIGFLLWERHKFLRDLKEGDCVEVKHPVHDFFNAKITYLDGDSVRVIDKRGGGHIVNRKDIYPKL